MRILCFGDSNTYGYDPRSPFGDRYSAENRWPELLAQQTGWEVINLGVNGREIPRNPYVLRSLHQHAPVDILLVMLGTNDLLQGACAAQAAILMESFLNRLLPRFRQVLLVAPPPLKRGEWVPDDHLIAESIQLAENYRVLAQKLGISFADSCSWNIQLAFDGVHLTEAGHRVFASKIAAEIETPFL